MLMKKRGGVEYIKIIAIPNLIEFIIDWVKGICINYLLTHFCPSSSVFLYSLEWCVTDYLIHKHPNNTYLTVELFKRILKMFVC
jgi:hypothetical protein